MASYKKSSKGISRFLWIVPFVVLLFAGIFVAFVFFPTEEVPVQEETAGEEGSLVQEGVNVPPEENLGEGSAEEETTSTQKTTSDGGGGGSSGGGGGTGGGEAASETQEEAFVEEVVCTNILPTCADGIDNDGDGAIDLEDSECASWNGREAGVEEVFCTDILPTCADGEDNDDDGAIDLEDSDCVNWEAREGQEGEQNLGTPLERVVPSTDPFNDTDGPFYHDVYRATSVDGLTWERDDMLLFDYASVPGAILRSDGTLFVYMVDGTQSAKGPFVARSEDLGETWTLYAMDIQNKPKNMGCGADPEPEELDDRTLRVYLVCFSQDHTQVISALSSDGIHFIVEDGTRAQSNQGEFLTDPDLVKIGDLWTMYISAGKRVVSFTSENGLDFTRDSGYRNTVGAVTGSVALSDSLARHYFCGNSGIESALSDGGETWTIEDGTRIATEDAVIVCDPTIVTLDDGSYMMFYKIQPQ